MHRRLRHLASGLLVLTALNSGRAMAESVSLPRSEVRTLHSVATGHEHRLFIAWPETPPPPAGYPVIYLLDANAWFGTVVDAVRVLGARTEATGVAPAIVVGLGYPTDQPFDPAHRALDYTPTVGAKSREVPGPTGGAGAFLRFIEEEVKPALARDHRLDATRQTLVGHSFGGLFVAHVLLNHPGAFQNYIAISPSLWWDNRAVLAGETALPERLAAVPVKSARNLFVAAGEFEQAPDPARPVSPERLARLRQNRMVDNAREFAARLAALPGEPLRVQFVEFPRENHSSLVPGAISRALSFLNLPPTAKP